ncbi:hypothetical protein JCM10207_008655 [Rhodosporidiobolus poonsookiae]
MSINTRQLSIKTGVVTRLVKEVQSYKDESETTKAKADAMEAAGEDEYEVRQQRRVAADSLQMIPDSEKRLAKAIAELEDLVASSEEELNGTQEYAKAKEALRSANPQ